MKLLIDQLNVINPCKKDLIRPKSRYTYLQGQKITFDIILQRISRIFALHLTYLGGSQLCNRYNWLINCLTLAAFNFMLWNHKRNFCAIILWKELGPWVPNMDVDILEFHYEIFWAWASFARRAPRSHYLEGRGW